MLPSTKCRKLLVPIEISFGLSIVFMTSNKTEITEEKKHACELKSSHLHLLPSSLAKERD